MKTLLGVFIISLYTPFLTISIGVSTSWQHSVFQTNDFYSKFYQTCNVAQTIISRLYIYGCLRRIHRVPKKTKQIRFCQNFVKFPQISIIFGRKMRNDQNICEVHSFSTSPNLRHHLTLLNANVPNCYITLNVVICNKLLAHNKQKVLYLAKL